MCRGRHRVVRWRSGQCQEETGSFRRSELAVGHWMQGFLAATDRLSNRERNQYAETTLNSAYIRVEGGMLLTPKDMLRATREASTK